jgi:heme/copper-type cytochrome/quinol oxidase subunit 3
MSSLERAQTARFAVIVLLFADFMLFAGWIGGLIVLRAGVESWGGVKFTALFPMGCVTTAVLVAGAVLAERVPVAAWGAGLLFLAGEGWQWMRLREAGIWFDSHDLFATVFFASGVLLGLHVLLGLAAGWRRNLGLYWRFLAGIRLLLFLLLSLSK